MVEKAVIAGYIVVLLVWLVPGVLRLLVKEQRLRPLRESDPGAFRRCFGWRDRAVVIGFVVWLVSFVTLLWLFDRNARQS